MPSPDRTGTRPEAEPTLADRARHRIEQVDSWLGAGGIHVGGVGTVLYFWRKVGLKRLLPVLLLVGFPFGQYSFLTYAANQTIPRMAGAIGVQFTAQEWSLHPFTLKALARNVQMRLPHDAAGAPVFTAAEVEFAGSLSTVLIGLPDLLTFHLFGLHQPFNEVVVRHGELHLERSLAGNLNLTELIDTVPRARIDELVAGLYRVNEIVFEDCRISYVEHVPGVSGGGVIQTVEASINVDGITGTVTGLVPPTADRQRPTRFNFHGRAADGVVQVEGVGAFVSADATSKPEAAAAAPDLKAVSAVGATGTPPDAETQVHLESIGAAAYARMVPSTTIVPIRGTIQGNISMLRTGTVWECRSNVVMNDVQLAPNPRVLVAKADFAAVQRALQPVVGSGTFDACRPFGGAPGPEGRPASRPASLMMASFNRQATAHASPAVQALVARDEQSLKGQVVNAALSDIIGQMAGPLGDRLTVAGGVKGVSRGIRKLFGSGR
jgi:hypothetical protein